MRHLQFLAIAGAIAILTTTTNTAEAAGSWGGGSSGGASSGSASSGGGGFLSRLKARHSGGSHGSSGGSASSGGYTVHHVSSGSSGGSSGGRVGPLRRLVAKLHAHRASRGSSGGSSSHGGSSGGRHASYAGGSSGGSASHSSHGSASHASHSSHSAVHSVSLGATSSYESPVVESSYQPYTPMGGTVNESGHSIIDSAPVGGSSLEGGSLGTETIIDAVRYESNKPSVEAKVAKTEIDPDAAMLTVGVPQDAVVTVNGHPTSSDGDLRKFMSRGLKDGYVYTYVVKVTFEKDGEEKTESKSVKLRRGDIERLDFEAPHKAEPAKPATDDVVTVVRIRVPADAEVTLAGNATDGEGQIRTFRTKQLKAGQQWSGYTVRVTTVVNGQKVSKERTIDVLAGSTNDLTFSFDNSSIASR